MNKKKEEYPELTEDQLFMYRLDCRLSMLVEILGHYRGILSDLELKQIQLAGYDPEDLVVE